MGSSQPNYASVDEFDLEKYLRVAVGTRPESFDWSEPGARLDEGTLFCLGFMLDTEANTIVNMRELLSTTIAEDPSIAAFLACWLYEEWSHSRTLGKLLETQGVRIDGRHFTELSRQTPGDYVAQKCARLAALLTNHFPAIHMTWGAINELTGILAYEALIDRAQHPMVTTVLSRIIKDERRHFAFYYNQARIRLKPRAAQILTSVALRAFWSPVGSPVRGKADMRRMQNYLFAGERGDRTAAQIDGTIARLPGLEWFDCMNRYKEGARLPFRNDARLAA
jgi:hypothetical protein